MSPSAYKNRKIFITGGTGFIGTNLAATLIPLGAKVTLLAHSKKGVKSLGGIEKKVRVVVGDIRDQALMEKLVAGQEIIFNLAAKVSHMDKNVISEEDLDINGRGQLILLEACKTCNPKVKIVFSSTRMVYGDMVKNPITETHPVDPLTIYGIHKLAAEKYHLSYFKRHGIRSTILRIGNPYGDRQHLSKGLYSLPGFFMNKAIAGETIEIWGDGKQLRDYIYIGDLIAAMLKIGLSKKTDGEIYNCGSGKCHQFRNMVETIIDVVGSGEVKYTPWPAHYQKIQADTYCFDISKLTKAIKWKPKTTLRQGFEKMYDFIKYAKV